MSRSQACVNPVLGVTETAVFGGMLVGDYGEQRSTPQPGQPLYLVLADLSLALKPFASNEKLTLLDYGCGVSPYRHLFPNSIYRRADAMDADDLDYRIGERSIHSREAGDLRSHPVDAGGGTYPEPQLYLAECHRLLRRGGRLILSTHGTFEEHGMPYVFRRWTVEGQKRTGSGRLRHRRVLPPDDGRKSGGVSLRAIRRVDASCTAKPVAFSPLVAFVV